MSDGDGDSLAGVLGLVLASFSLAWQFATHVLTGGRVKVTLRVGGIGDVGLVTQFPDRLSKELEESLIAQGVHRPVVMVTAANVGRQPVTVVKWGLKSERGAGLYPMGDGPELPHRLEVGAAATWAVDFARVTEFMHTLRTIPRPSLLQRPPSSPVKALVAGWRVGQGTLWDSIVGVVELPGERVKESWDFLRDTERHG